MKLTPWVWSSVLPPHPNKQNPHSLKGLGDVEIPQTSGLHQRHSIKASSLDQQAALASLSTQPRTTGSRPLDASRPSSRATPLLTLVLGMETWALCMLARHCTMNYFPSSSLQGILMKTVGLPANSKCKRSSSVLPYLISALAPPQPLPTATLHPTGVNGNTWPPLFLQFPLSPLESSPLERLERLAWPSGSHSLTGHCEGGPCWHGCQRVNLFAAVLRWRSWDAFHVALCKGKS